MLVLHDNLNPTREVLIAKSSITSVVPLGSGSIINGIIAVSETPEQIEKLLK